MLYFVKGQEAKIICTLTESQTIVDAVFLFVFESRSTGEKIKFVAGADESGFPERYNEFTITVNDYFEDYEEGFYDYKVYEQTDAENTDETGLNRIEAGVMLLKDIATSEPAAYNNTIETKFYKR